jgi:hypothetical protein
MLIPSTLRVSQYHYAGNSKLAIRGSRKVAKHRIALQIMEWGTSELYMGCAY